MFKAASPMDGQRVQKLIAVADATCLPATALNANLGYNSPQRVGLFFRQLKRTYVDPINTKHQKPSKSPAYKAIRGQIDVCGKNRPES
ncbi:hypothetical protein AB1E33_17105 [Ruegeria sp. 2012CJ15-1]